MRTLGIVFLFRSLRNRNYRLYYLGQLISLHGTWMQTVAQAWLVYRLTNSSLMLGLVTFCSQVPVLLLGLLGGVTADRLPRRKLLITAQAAAMTQALVLAVLTLGGWIEAWHIVLLSLALGVIQAFEMPARHSFIAEIVPRKDLLNAIALNSSAFNVARFIGPSLAGLLVALYGEGTVFLVNGFSFVAVLAGLLFIQVPPRAGTAAHGSIVSSLLEGLEFAWQVSRIRAALLMVGVISLVAASVMVLMPVFAREIFARGPQALGLLLAAIGVGALIGTLRLARRRTDRGLPLAIGLAAFGAGASVLLFTLINQFWLAMPVLALAGFCHATAVASTNTLIQLTADDAIRGRVMSLFSMIFIGMMPVGSLVAGALALSLGANNRKFVCAAMHLWRIRLSALHR